MHNRSTLQRSQSLEEDNNVQETAASRARSRLSAMGATGVPGSAKTASVKRSNFRRCRSMGERNASVGSFAQSQLSMALAGHDSRLDLADLVGSTSGLSYDPVKKWSGSQNISNFEEAYEARLKETKQRGKNDGSRSPMKSPKKKAAEGAKSHTFNDLDDSDPDHHLGPKRATLFELPAMDGFKTSMDEWKTSVDEWMNRPAKTA